jgi:acetyltransferase-like isoleucine patch superfamily enzyme
MDKLGKESISNQDDREILERLKAGEPIRLDDPQYFKIQEVVNRTIKLNAKLNASEDVEQIRKNLNEITGSEIDASSIIFVPFFTNFGRFIQIGKNVFINHACSFLDMVELQ